jgi:hypothetical protein
MHEAVISGVLRQWFEDSDEIDALEQLVVCSGFRPTD